MFTPHNFYEEEILEVTQHHYVTSLGVLPLVIALNLDAYKALSPKAKAALAKSGDLMAKLQGEASDVATKEMIATIKADPKQTLVYPSEADLKTMDSLFKPINDGIRKRVGDKLWNGYVEVLKDIRAGK